ncbi:hypothetical protein DPMN_098776 [Dreissena polymorpha]|uniref:Uncharacterized protein n=1 Tax=Dreissena polymorpha TaxID=45954 RepID=A0A9D4LCY4_DREPO|nr:hypothetical protein DPMN_098776 [Dreissena polymorpha]
MLASGTLRSLCWHQGHCDIYAGIRNIAISMLASYYRDIAISMPASYNRDIAISMLASGTLRSLCWHQGHCDLYAGILLQGHCDLYAGILLLDQGPNVVQTKPL